VETSRLPRSFLEQHHLAGRAAGAATVVLCRNCHAILTDWQQDWEPRLRRPRTWVERLAAFLHGLADWCLQLARMLTDLAERLHAWVRWLLGGMSGPAPA
jgi:hypothetical protein